MGRGVGGGAVGFRERWGASGWRIWVVTIMRTVDQQPSPKEVHPKHSPMVGMLDERFLQATELLAAVGPDSSPSLPSPWPTGGRSGRTTRRTASQRRPNTGLTWWASSRTGLRCGGSSAQPLPSSTIRGRSTAALCSLLPSTLAISPAWSHQCLCPQRQPDQSAKVTLFHHLKGHDQQRSRHAKLLLEGLVWC